MNQPNIALTPGLRVLITAGAAGIGLSIAKTLSASGARIHICDIDDQALTECAKARPDWGVSHCDVSDMNQVESLFDDVVANFSGLDVLINNAGIAGPTGGIDEITPDDWRKTIDTNLNSQFYCSNRAVPLLKKSFEASIICISSVAGRLGYAQRTPYAASKWAIIGLVKSLAIELGPHRIRANALLPGIVEGQRISRVISAYAQATGVSFEEAKRQYINKASLGRMVSAQDVANQALFLCSPFSVNISGQSISICGNIEYL